jgi:Tol biopolymer transport system component
MSIIPQVASMKKLVIALVSLGFLLSATESVVQSASAHAASTAGRSVSTKLNGNAYDIVVDGRTVASVPVSDRAYTVWTTISPDGASLAFIADYNASSGSGLHVLDVATGTRRLVDSSRVTSAAFSPDSARVAYTAAAEHSAEVRLADTKGTGRTVATVPGREVSVLGWDEAGGGIYVVRHPDRQSDDQLASSLSKLTIANAELRDLVASGADGVYRDFRLVTIGGKRHVSFIRAEQVHICGGQQRLVLALPDGTVVREFGVTEDGYGRAVWREDGSAVAYEAQACLSPEEISSPEKGAERLARHNGIYVADLPTGETRRVLTGFSSEYSLEAVAADAVHLGSPRRGRITIDNATVQKSGPAAAASLTQAPDGQRTVTRIPAPYVNQRWDTPVGFTGESACGPTSAVMTLAGRELAESPMWTDKTDDTSAPHWTNYGRYVTDSYRFPDTETGTTFDRTWVDWDYTGAWPGAYGWMVETVCGEPPRYPLRPCTVHDRLTDFLEKHGREVEYIRPETGGDAAWVRAQLDAGKLVIVSGWFRKGAIKGHLSVITGYTSDDQGVPDGSFYVHDSYGPQTDGNYAGADQLYTWEYMDPKAFWASGSSSSTTSRLSVSARSTPPPAGSDVRPEADDASRLPSISHDGRYVAFESVATNLVASDTNNFRDIFVRDRTNGTTNRASVRGSGGSLVQSNNNSSSPSISADGRYVAFDSAATNLVDGKSGIFVRDMHNQTTHHVAGGVTGPRRPSISADGRYVAYETAFGSLQIEWADTLTGEKKLVSVGLDGHRSNAWSTDPSISGDGKFVAFSSGATNLDGQPTGGRNHVYLRNMDTNTTTRVSAAPGGALADDSSRLPALSADGRYVAYESLATNLVAEDTNRRWDIFRHDRVTGATVRVTVSSQGAQQEDNSVGNAPKMSANGRYVAFSSYAGNLVPFDDGSGDVFVHDVATGTTRLVSTALDGSSANDHSWNAAISGDGRTVAFDSMASDLVKHDTADNRDVFVSGPLAEPVVVDNLPRNNDPGSAQVKATGTWRSSTYVKDHWANDYQVANEEGRDLPGTFAFKFYLPSATVKSVDAWWTEGPTRTTQASYKITDSGGRVLATVTADQRGGGGRWNTLGTWSFPAGWNTVTVSSSPDTGVLIADALRVRWPDKPSRLQELVDAGNRDGIRQWFIAHPIATANSAVAALDLPRRERLASVLLSTIDAGEAEKVALLRAMGTILGRVELGFYGETWSYSKIKVWDGGSEFACREREIRLSRDLVNGHPDAIRDTLAYESLHSFTCVNGGAGWAQASALGEGAAIWIFKKAFPINQDGLPRDTAEHWAEATYGTKLRFPNYPMGETPTQPKLNELFRALSASDGSELRWDRTEDLNACFDLYWKDLVPDSDFKVWLEQAAKATYEMLQDLDCRQL